MIVKKKVTKKKTKKKPKIVTLKRKAFRLWSIKVRNAYGNKCAICGAEGKIDAHHITSRRTCPLPLKFHPINGIALCPSHHKFGADSFHNDPLWSVLWMQEHRPKTIDWLIERRKDNFKVTREVMETILADIQEPLSDEELNIMGLTPSEREPE